MDRLEVALHAFVLGWMAAKKGTGWRQRDDRWSTGKHGALYRMMFRTSESPVYCQATDVFDRLSIELLKRGFVLLPQRLWPKGKKNAPSCCPGKTHPGGWFLHQGTGAFFSVTLPKNMKASRNRIWASLEGELSPTEVIALARG